MRNLKHIFIAFLIVFVSIFGTLRIFGDDFSLPLTHFFVYREGNRFLDKLYKYKFTPSSDIVIIKIDNESLNNLQAQSNLKTLTIPKSVYIDVITKLKSVNVKGIAFDIVFQNKDREEEEFAKVLEWAGNVVISRFIQRWACVLDADGAYETCDGLPRSVYRDVPQGHVEVNQSIDQKVLRATDGSGTVDALSLKLYEQNNFESGAQDTSHDILTDKNTFIPYFWPPNTYKSISLSAFLSLSKIDLVSNLSNKYVFIGESGTLIHDAHISPVSATLMDGVESHAHMLDGLLQWRMLTSWSKYSTNMFMITMLLLIMMVSLYMLLPKFLSLSLAVFITFWAIWMARYAYFRFGIVIEIAPLIMAGGVFSFPLTYIYRFFIVDREKRVLTDAFSRYVDPHVVEKIARDAHKIELGGESRHLTVLFSDIAGFTTLSEKLTPNDLFYLMSSYLSRMTDILTRNGGTLDKYIGDAVMGFYGAPLEMPDHPLHACHTALEMRKALPIFNTELLARGLDEIDFRIGIATGDVVVGNIGSHDRFNYTVLGDTVNLASRLEATSKEYGTHILVSESTYEVAKGEFLFRRLDRIAVKGKTEWVLIYELIADIRDTKIDRSIYERYEQGLEKYFASDYLGAGKIFESGAPVDPPSKVMAHRCLDILEGRVKVEGGVYKMEHK
jgi:class 3 adenylate cyclase/CHASE2 domain-containing sensor protein